MANVQELTAWVREVVKADSLPTPPFRQNVGWASDYEPLFEQTFERQTPVAVAALVALERGRVLVAGRGGSGKTVALKRLCVELAERGSAVPVYMPLFGWNAAHQAAWDELPKKSGNRIDYLLENFVPSAFVRFVSGMPVPRLLVVDSLNEVRPSVGAEMLDEFSDLVTYRGGWRVIVADRLLRRSFPPALPWTVGTLLPIDSAEQKRVAGEEHATLDFENPLLTTAYFLDLNLKHQGAGASAADQIRGWFEHHSGLEKTKTSLDTLAHAALSLYQTRSRTFALSELSARVGNETVDALVESGAIIVTGGNAFFEHQLKHDFLVALALMKHMRSAAGSSFRSALDVATFDASSFDVLALALQIAETSAVADNFVRAAYDWNLYGAAYAVAEARTGGVSRVSPEMELVLMALLAEKRWDIFRTTSTKSLDALRQFPASLRRPFLEAPTLEAVFAIVRAHDSKEAWYREWVALFGGDRAALGGDCVSLLRKKDVFGWTAANVLKRLELGNQEQVRLRGVLNRGEEPSLRWRVAHVLGAFPTKENVGALLHALDAESDEWVRYGAVRSLLELAAKHQHVRSTVLSQLAERAPTLLARPITLRELHDALFVDVAVAPPAQWNAADWKKAIGPLLETLHDASPSRSSREFWQLTAYDLRRMYG